MALHPHKKRLATNVFSLSILQAFTYILPLATLPYLINVLGVDNYGLIVFAQTIVMFFSVFIDYGFNLSATREVAICKKDGARLEELLSAVFLIKSALTLLSIIPFYFIVASVERFSEHASIFFVSFSIVAGQIIYPVWFFQGVEKMHFITRITIFSKLLFTALVFILIKGPEDLLLVPALNSGAAILIGLLSVYAIRNKLGYSFAPPSARFLVKCFKDSSSFFLSRAAVTLYTTANKLTLGLFLGNASVGYYDIAEKIYAAAQAVYTPIVQSLYPYVAVNKDIALFKKIFVVVCVTNTAGVAVLFFSGPQLLELVFSDSIALESVLVLNQLLVALLIVVPSILLGYPLLGALGHARYANLSVTFAGATHLLGLTFLAFVNNITIYNVASMLIITQAVDFSYRLYWVKKKKLFSPHQTPSHQTPSHQLDE